jgi:hypothetical protein
MNCVPVSTDLSIDGPESMVINNLTIHELGSIWK